MSNMEPTDILSEFLAQNEPPSRCATCNNRVVADLIVAHLDKLAAGETRVTLSYVHEHLLVAHGAVNTYSCIRRHVNRCLNRNSRTGKPLK